MIMEDKHVNIKEQSSNYVTGLKLIRILLSAIELRYELYDSLSKITPLHYLEKQEFNLAYIKEYYSKGIRFLFGMKYDEIYIYIQAEFIGRYVPKTRKLSEKMPFINGFIKVYSAQIQEFAKTDISSVLSEAFDLMKRGEKTFFALRSNLKIIERQRTFRGELSFLLRKLSSFLGDVVEERPGRNPFTLKHLDEKNEDDVWIIQSYQEITLLIGKNKQIDKMFGSLKEKFYVFANNSPWIDDFVPRRGDFKRPPIYVKSWMLIYGVYESSKKDPDFLSESIKLAINDFQKLIPIHLNNNCLRR